ncbi:MAG: hypothetical protein AAF636_10035 [Pseudomonadota bacterium]
MDKLTFYFDRNIGNKLPQALTQLRPPFDVRWHDKEKFPHDMPDDEWMAIVGPKDWVVVGQDWKFHLIDAELKAIRQHSMKCVYLPGSGQTRWETYCRFVRSHKRIIEKCVSEKAPLILDLKLNGHLRKIAI